MKEVEVVGHYTDFGAEARKIMLKKDIKLTSLANQLGISVTYVSEILKGTRKGASYKSQISKILNMSE